MEQPVESTKQQTTRTNNSQSCKIQDQYTIKQLYMPTVYSNEQLDIEIWECDNRKKQNKQGRRKNKQKAYYLSLS